MKKYANEWDKILNIMKESMNPHKYDMWISELQLMKVDEDTKSILVTCSDPYRAGYVADHCGANFDRAAEIILGEGYRVYITYDKNLQKEGEKLIVRMAEYASDFGVMAMLVINEKITDEDLIDMKLAEFAEIKSVAVQEEDESCNFR